MSSLRIDSENKLRAGVERLNQLTVVSTQLKDEQTKQTAQLDQVCELHSVESICKILYITCTVKYFTKYCTSILTLYCAFTIVT